MIEIFVDGLDNIEAKGLIPGQKIKLHFDGEVAIITRIGDETIVKIEEEMG
jgi:hypothetical protein